MKFLQIVFFLILISCGNSTSGEEGVNEKLNSEGSNDGVALPADIEAAMEPIMGGAFDLKMDIKNVTNDKSYLIASIAGGNFRVDSSMIQNGKLHYSNPKGVPQGLYFVSLPAGKFIQVMLGEDQELEMSFDVNNIVQTMEVKGNKNNALFYTNLKYEEAYNPRYQNLTSQMRAIQDKKGAEYKALEKQKNALEDEREAHLNSLFEGNEDLLFVVFKKSGQNPRLREGVSDEEKVYFYRKEFWDNVDFSDGRLLRTPVITNKLNRYIKEITPQSPDSIKKYASMLVDKILPYPQYYKYITNWIALEYEPAKTTLMDAEAVFVHMVQNYFTRERAFWSDSMEVYALQQRASEMAQSLVGIKGPDVISTDPDGKTRSIYEMDEDYIIVYLYNPTCEHCMKETPELVKWYNQKKSTESVGVYAIAIDTDETEWKNYVRDKKMDGFANVFDPTNRSIYAKYYVNVTPELYVLNKERTIIAKNLKVFQIDTMIERDRSGK